MSNPTTVQIGGRQVTIPEFSGYRALEVAGTLAEISDGIPEIQNAIAEFRRRYERENVAEMERTFALFQFGPERLAGISDADWQANGNMLRLPKSPETQEIVWAVFPKAYKLARQEMLRLAALFEVSDAELEEWDEANDVDLQAKLLERGRALAHESRGTELLELLFAGAEHCQREFGDKIQEIGGRLGNVLRLFGWQPEGPDQGDDQEPEEETPPPPAAPELEQPSSSEDGTKPTSSTSSPATSGDGAEPTRSDADLASSSISGPA